MKATDDDERSRRLDGDVARPICLETERRAVDPPNGAVGRGVSLRRDRESIDAVAISGQRLQLVEMHTDAILRARHLGWIRATLDECGNDDRVARCRPG